MKKKILQMVLLAALIVPMRAFSFGDAAINIRNFDNDLITVVMDGAEYPTAVNEFHLAGISSGRHFVKVFTRERYGWNYSSFTHLAFSGPVILHPGEEIFAEIDQFNQMHVKKVMNIINPVHCITVLQPQLSNLSKPNCSNNQYSNYFPNDNCGNNNYYSGPFAMDDGTYCMLKKSIADKWFDSSKMELAQMALHNNYMNAQQVAGIMNLFDFESTKLDFAKFAFSHTVDPQNYWMVNDAFSFSSSISSLNEFIGF